MPKKLSPEDADQRLVEVLNAVRLGTSTRSFRRLVPYAKQGYLNIMFTPNMSVAGVGLTPKGAQVLQETAHRLGINLRAA